MCVIHLNHSKGLVCDLYFAEAPLYEMVCIQFPSKSVAQHLWGNYTPLLFWAKAFEHRDAIRA